MMRRCVLGAAALLLLLASGAGAQVGVDRFQRSLERIERETREQADQRVPVEQRSLFDYGAFAVFSLVSIDDLQAHTHVLEQYDLNVYAHLNLDGVHDFYARGRASFHDWSYGTSLDTHGQEWGEVSLDRATYRFDLGRYFQAYEGRKLPANVVFQGGRQLVNWANGLTLTNDIDGALITLSYFPFSLDILAGVTDPQDTDFDLSRPGFHNDTHRGFYGGLLSAQITPATRPFVYALAQQDYNEFDPLITGPLVTNFHYNSYYLGAGINGHLGDRFSYGLEAVYEGGSGLSNSFDNTVFRNTGTVIATPQTEQQIQAFAVDARLDWTPNDPHRSRVGGEVIVGSGDRDRLRTTSTFGGNQSGTFDQAFNAFGLVNTGLAFAPPVSNVLIGRVGASTYPLADTGLFKRLQVGMDVFVFGKFDHRAPIDEPTNTSGYLGWEPDLWANWQITSDLALAVRYGVFFPGTAITGTHHIRNFVYMGVTLSF
jgi:hypothetical protein